MNSSDEARIAAFESLRKELGTRITTGAELLRVREVETEAGWTADGVISGSRGRREDFGDPRECDGSAERLRTFGSDLPGIAPGGEDFPRGQLTEIVERGGGGGLVLSGLLSRARRRRRYVMLFDLGCGFDPEGVPERDLECLLWIGCRSAKEAIEALDVASRDENFDLFLLDFRGGGRDEWRSVRPRQWYRILGQLRMRGASAVLFADGPVTSVAKRRLEVDLALQCRDFSRERDRLRDAVEWRSREAITEPRPGSGSGGRRLVG